MKTFRPLWIVVPVALLLALVLVMRHSLTTPTEESAPQSETETPAAAPVVEPDYIPEPTSQNEAPLNRSTAQEGVEEVVSEIEATPAMNSASVPSTPRAERKSSRKKKKGKKKKKKIARRKHGKIRTARLDTSKVVPPSEKRRARQAAHKAGRLLAARRAKAAASGLSAEDRELSRRGQAQLSASLKRPGFKMGQLPEDSGEAVPNENQQSMSIAEPDENVKQSFGESSFEKAVYQ